jgi:hypothetical protein
MHCSTQPVIASAWATVEHRLAHQRNPGALLLMNRRVLHSVQEKVALECVGVVCSVQGSTQALLDVTDYDVGVPQYYAYLWYCVGRVLRFVCSVLYLQPGRIHRSSRYCLDHSDGKG